jgi:hypothetical protein
VTLSGAIDPDQIWRQKSSPGATPAPPSTALTAARTVYVNAVTGNDVRGTGTLALPWKTLMRAWTERQQYLVLRAKFTVQLLGVGPYELPSMLGSQCADEGFFVVLGDPSAEVLLATGHATGDMVGNTIPTSALVVNAHRNEFLRFTSGAETAGVYQLNSNAANSVTVANSWLRFVSSDPIVNGDTFRIFRPGTQIRVSGGFALAPRLENLTGVSGANTFGEDIGRHVFYDVHFVTADSSALILEGSALVFALCRSDLFLFSVTSSVACGLLDSEVVGIVGPASRDQILGAGFVAAYCQIIASRLIGTLSWVDGLVLSGGQVYFAWCGGIGAGDVTIYTAFMEGFGDFCEMLLEATISVINAQAVCLMNASSGIWHFAVTSGPCIKVQNGGQLSVVTSDLTGGTTDAAAAAVDVSGGGRALFRGVSPALTGGTLGSDLRTTNVPIAANAALAANGSSVAIAADVLFGEVLGRLGP